MIPYSSCRDVLASINSVTQWISPFSLMINAVNAALEHVWAIFTLNSSLMVLETILLLVISIWTIRKKRSTCRMKKNHTFRPTIILLTILFLLAIVVQVFAIDKDEFVYAGNYYNGISYSSNFIPPKTDAIYLLANQDNILSARLTQTYYWPLTNEIKASWDKQNQLVEGQLEILQNGKLIDTLNRTKLHHSILC